MGLFVLLAMIVLSIVVPWASPYGTTEQAGIRLSLPSIEHPFGTDQLGRDVFVRTFAAARLDMALALVGVAGPLVVGTLLGAIIGSSRLGWVRGGWRLVIDAMNAFPFFVLVVGIVAMLGPGVQGTLIALFAVNWARYARIASARAAILRNEGYIQAAQVSGYSRIRVLTRHLIPNTVDETTAYALSDFVVVIITIAALSFLGAGVRPPTPEWGAMMADGRIYMRTEWWITVFPGLALAVTGSGVALFAQGWGARSEGRL